MYEHTQAGILMRAILGGTTLLVLGVTAVVGLHPIIVAVLAAQVAALLLFGSLTVAIDGDTVRLHFGVGLIRKSFPLADIRSARAVRGRWWHGWGIRWIPGTGWLYNVSGFDAVELDLDGDRKVRIGTDEPQALTAAVERALAARPSRS